MREVAEEVGLVARVDQLVGRVRAPGRRRTATRTASCRSCTSATRSAASCAPSPTRCARSRGGDRRRRRLAPPPRDARPRRARSALAARGRRHEAALVEARRARASPRPCASRSSRASLDHGWSIVKALAPDGEIGRVWSLSRPLTYRALAALADAELIEPRGSEPGDGPPRTIWRATREGPARVARLASAARCATPATCAPSSCSRSRWARPRPSSPAPSSRRSRRSSPDLQRSADADPTDVVARWRLESAEATRRFLESLV